MTFLLFSETVVSNPHMESFEFLGVDFIIMCFAFPSWTYMYGTSSFTGTEDPAEGGSRGERGREGGVVGPPCSVP